MEQITRLPTPRITLSQDICLSVRITGKEISQRELLSDVTYEINWETLPMIQGPLLRQKNVFIGVRAGTKGRERYTLFPKPTVGLPDIQTYLNNPESERLPNEQAFLYYITHNGNENAYRNLLEFIGKHFDPSHPYYFAFESPERLRIPIHEFAEGKTTELTVGLLFKLEEIGLSLTTHDMFTILDRANYRSDSPNSIVYPPHLVYVPDEKPQRVIWKSSPGDLRDRFGS